jgi:spore germination protein YaaH/flagellar hook assembly protein FlgD
VTEDRARPPSDRPDRLRLLRGLGALALVVALLAEPGLAAARAGGAGAAERSGAADRSGTDGRAVASTGRVAPARQPAGPAEPVEPSPDRPEAALESSIVALDAAAHENDRIEFTPGSRVTVPFVPRPDDGWPVDGVAPRRLPAGAASGRAIAAARQGTVWAPLSEAPQARQPQAQPGVPRPIDGPSGPSGPAAEPASAVVTTESPPDPPGATDLRRQVFGFLPYWELSDGSTRLDYQLLSTIAYFGVGADANGNLIKRNRDGSTSVGWAGWASSRMTSVIQAAHRRGTRVVLTVQAFAWTTNQATNQSALLGSPAARLTLARQIAAAVRDRGADGVNLDFEPLVSGRSDEFVALIRSIRAELARIARGYQVTFDTTGSIGNYPIEAATAPGAADAIFIMGYDYRTASSGSAGSIAPLNGSGYDLIDTVLAYTERVPARRLILGIPYYGRAWSTLSDGPRAKTRTGTKYGPSASVTYANAVELARQHGRRYDSRESSAWVAYRRRNCSAAHGCVTTWREVYYDDAQSLRAKYDTINRYGLRGAGIWALGYDGARPELYQVIVAKFLHDTTPPDTGIDVLPAREGDEGFPVSWSAVDMNPIRSYDVQYSVDGGPWRPWFSGTRTTEAIMLGLDGHGYAFRARATDAKGNRGRWNIASLPTARPTLQKGGFAVVRAATLTVRSRPDTSGATVSQLSQGDVVALTGGPVQADGYTWYQVAGPLDSWAPAEPVRSGDWVAGASASAAYLAPRTAPNTTIVDAAIVGFSFGAGGPGSLGLTNGARASRAFSPNGDGSEDRLGLRWTNNVALDSLTLRVFRTDGSLIGTRALPDPARGAQSWAWDGAVGGKTLPDGGYVLQLVGQVGSRTFTAPSIRPISPGQIARFGVTVDTVGPTMTGASLSGALISPRRDGRHDAVALRATSTGATRWRLTASPLTTAGTGTAVRTIVGSGGSPRTAWDGRTDGGTAASDGRYRLTLAVLDDAGNFASRSWDVVVDGRAPTLTAAATPPAFSPDGDRTADATVIGWTTDEPARSTIRIYRGSRLVRTFAGGSATGGAVRWDGRSSTGVKLADGTYQARIVVEDAAGNRRMGAVGLRIDRTACWLRWSPTAFFPQDLDGLAKTARATFRLTRAARTTLTVVSARGGPVRTVWSDRLQGAGTIRWTWDGRDGTKAMVPPGTYVLVLTARSAAGTTTLQRAIVVDAFVVDPLPAKVKAGQTLTVAFRTVEPLSSRPTVTFDQTGRPPVTRFATPVGPDRYVASFRVARASGPASIRVGASDRAGRRNVSARAVLVQ